MCSSHVVLLITFIVKKNTLNLAAGTLSLDQLHVGDSGFVGEVSQPLDHQHHQLTDRLMEIGFIPGEPVQVLHKGFLGGGPIAVRIGQSTFALRPFEAELISVIRSC